MTWNPFFRNKKADSEQNGSSPESDEKIAGKGHPTPKRKQAQAKNIRPLIPDRKDRKARSKQERAKLRAQQDSEYAAMKTGNIAEMPKSERLPVRVYVRDYIDARWNLAEFFVPVAVVCLLVSLFISSIAPTLSLWLAVATYVYLFAIVIDIVIMWWHLKKKLVAKFGASEVKASRAFSYAISRSLQMRRFRLPKPRNAHRGQWPR